MDDTPYPSPLPPADNAQPYYPGQDQTGVPTNPTTQPAYLPPPPVAPLPPPPATRPAPGATRTYLHGGDAGANPPPPYAPPPPPALMRSPLAAPAPLPPVHGSGYHSQPLYPSQPLYQSPVNPSQPIYMPPPQPVVYVQPYVVPPVVVVQDQSNTPVVVEVLCAFLLGLHGIGWLMAGKTATGVLLLVGSFVWAAIYWVTVLATFGIGWFCVGPLNILFLALSAVALNNDIRARRTGRVTY